MKKRTKKQSFPKFYIIYFSCLVVAVLLVTVLLGILSQRLAEYESAQPKYIAGEVFAKYFEPTVDYSALLADAEYNAGNATSAEITDHLTKVISDSRLTYSLGSSASEDAMTYIVKAGNVKIAAINLVLSGEETEHGYETYKYDSLELFIQTEESSTTQTPDTDPPVIYTVTVHAPEGYSVKVREIQLTDSHIIGYYKDKTAVKYFPSDIEGIDYCTYRISNLESIPESVTVTDGNGKAAEVIETPLTNSTLNSENSFVYTAKPVSSDALEAELTEFVTEAITGYAAYMQADKRFSSIKEYYDSDSALYKTIEKAGGDLWMVMDHDSYEFTDIELGEFFVLSETTVSCHISFNHLLYKDGKTTRPDVIDMYVFLHKTADGEYKIYEWCNN